MLPIPDLSGWLRLVLNVAVAVVGAIYVYRVFLPGIRNMIGSEPDYAERAAELMNQRRKEEQAADDDYMDEQG